jgi:hypothetical protein
MARYSVFAVLTSVLAVSVVFTMVVAADAPHDYAKQLVGCWLGARKFDVYHADGTFGFKRNEDAPEEVGGRWRVEGDKLIIAGPTGHGVATAAYTVISCTDHTLILEIDGYREEYQRYSPDCQKKA